MLIQVQFHEGAGRYTYNAPQIVCVGDRVRVPVGWSARDRTGTVVAIGAPPFEYAGDIKGIIEIIPCETDVVLTVNPDEIDQMYSRVSTSAIFGKDDLMLLLDDIRKQAKSNLGRD